MNAVAKDPILLERCAHEAFYSLLFKEQLMIGTVVMNVNTDSNVRVAL